ncbi:thioesterase family protein [Staphylococcus canis]|uniref:Thioesterase n=1 Tax=Staphylococcus canis TaxID=2724942 RepID=A0ABS0T8V1_9STAP|nr:thioesterase family protein [Staphylococcus canis]MBI5974872.1 thioesterase [Staphylococcus canis]
MTQYAYQTTVQAEWVDHNQHMNDAAYSRVFSDTTDDWLAYLGLTPQAIEDWQYTVFTLEHHLTFLKEMKQSEPITVRVQLYDYDAKRLHVFMSMYNEENELTATYEVMLMGIDTVTGRPAPFKETMFQAIENAYKAEPLTEKPKQLGHQIGIRHK